MEKIKKLKGKNVSLGPIGSHDAEQWAEWLNDLEVSLPLGDEAYSVITVNNQKDLISDFVSSNTHVFSIIHNDTDANIGRCLIFNVDQINRKAMVGIFIGEQKYWNHGYGQEALKLLLDYGFNLLNLNNIMLGVFEFNKNAIACYKKIGFKEIGRRRQARIIGQEKYDGILMDLLAEEFSGSYIESLVK